MPRLQRLPCRAVIIAFGKRLELAHTIITSGVVYFRRLFHKPGSFADLDGRIFAVVAIFIAAKVEEVGLHSNAYWNGLVEWRKAMMASSGQSAEYLGVVNCILSNYTRETIVELELYMMTLLDFCLVVHQPYRLLLQYATDAGKAESQCMRTAWWLINDTYRCDMCLEFLPHEIALTAFYMACVYHEINLYTWFSELQIEPDNLARIARVLLDFYSGLAQTDRATLAQSVVGIPVWPTRRPQQPAPHAAAPTLQHQAARETTPRPN